MKRLAWNRDDAGTAGMASAEGRWRSAFRTPCSSNGWREQMVCAMKAEALASGKVESLNIAHRNTDAAGQLEDIRNLIQKGVNAIVVNPANADGINAASRRRRMQASSWLPSTRLVTEPSAYMLSNKSARIRLSRRKVAVRADGWRGCRGLHARRGRCLARTTTATRASSGRWPSIRTSPSRRRSLPAGSRTRQAADQRHHRGGRAVPGV